MQLFIRHETIYRYSAPVTYTIQQLRLTPRAELHQHAISWQIKSSGQRHAYIDAYGNQAHTLTITGQHHELAIIAEGIVELTTPYQGRITDPDTFSPLVFTVPTRLTEPVPAIMDFAQKHLPDSGQTSTAALLNLATHIRGAVEYQTGATIVTTSASDALLLGRGVCQDHAHIMLACCHARGIPARYVSGYIDPESTGHADSHAWVDVWVEDADYSGWVSVDATHAVLMTDSYCRLAIGRDYDSAAPVRGVRRGGGLETLSVTVQVTPR
ncbi:transglutaminase [Undibacterium sp. YM2]|jgi:transglutaminase-like putative cysteine protease|uniref:transglutaminase family protein n=1 Tax=Undibacterium sp. YM2 TaxID=2058625 RepID=UPI001331C4B9|nr:transglutaminase family protein [Undibacterium sp. YM2]BBB64880.1 transglutaminase [Undibacterium sp. YM2]